MSPARDHDGDALDDLVRAVLVPSLDPQQELALLRSTIELLADAITGDQRATAAARLRARLEPTSKLPLPGTPVVALRDLVVFPHTLEHPALVSSVLFVGRPTSMAAIEAALTHRCGVLLVSLREPAADPAPSTLHEVGTIARITSVLRTADDTLRIAFTRERQRVRITGYALEAPYLCARIDHVPLPPPTSRAAELLPVLRAALVELSTRGPLHERARASQLVELFDRFDPQTAADTLAEAGPGLSRADRQALLELPTVEAQLEQLVAMFARPA